MHNIFYFILFYCELYTIDFIKKSNRAEWIVYNLRQYKNKKFEEKARNYWDEII